MENVIQSLKENLDYENNYYFYHETSNGKGLDICNEGLLLTGENILGVKNVLFTTASPLTEEITNYDDELISFLRSEKQTNPNRSVNEMVIIGIPKEDMDFALTPIQPNETENNDIYGANFIVDTSYILGCIDLTNEELIKNENYFDYNDNYTY